MITYPITTKSGKILRNEQERDAYLREQSAIATACLFMVSVHATMANGVDIIAAAYPWECLDVAQSFRLAGAVSVCMYPGRGDGSWRWFKDTKTAQRVRALAAARAVSS